MDQFTTPESDRTGAKTKKHHTTNDPSEAGQTSRYKPAQSIDSRKFRDLENSIRGMTVYRSRVAPLGGTLGGTIGPSFGGTLGGTMGGTLGGTMGGTATSVGLGGTIGRNFGTNMGGTSDGSASALDRNTAITELET